MLRRYYGYGRMLWFPNRWPATQLSLCDELNTEYQVKFLMPTASNSVCTKLPSHHLWTHQTHHEYPNQTAVSVSILSNTNTNMSHIMDTSTPLSKLGTPGPYHQVTLPFRPRCTLQGAHPSDPVKNPINTGSPRSRAMSMNRAQLWAMSKQTEVIPEFSLEAKKPIEPDETSENSKKHKTG